MTARRIATIGILVAAGVLAGWAILQFLRKPRGGETEIIVGDGSIWLESKSVDWANYKKYPNDTDALVLISKKEKGKLESVSDGTTTVQCGGFNRCVVVVNYQNSDGLLASIAARSGKRGNEGKGFTLVTTIPLSEYDLVTARVLRSKDQTFHPKSAQVWTDATMPTPLCPNQPCKITLDYK